MPGAIRERWYADDWEFTEGDIRDVEYRSGQLGTPAMRGSNAEVPNRTGEVWRPKKHAAGGFTLEVWLGTYQRQAQALWDELLRAVVQPHRLVSWRRITADGETRTCQGEVTGALEPTAVGQSAYRASIEVTVPAGYWAGDQLFTVASTPGGPAGQVLDLSVFSPSTAPLDALTVTFTGNLVNPALTDLTTRGRGDSVSYAGTVAAGRTLTLVNSSWQVLSGGGWAYNTEALNYSGERFLELAATPPGITHRVRFDATTIGAGAGVAVSGYRSYLC